jgi:hypothetical protein
VPTSRVATPRQRCSMLAPDVPARKPGYARLLTHRPGALEQSLRAVERLAQAPAVKLLLDPGLLRFEPCVIPRLAQCRRLGIAHLRHAFEQARLAEDLQQAE